MGYGKRSRKHFWRYWRLRILLIILLFVGGISLVYHLSPKREQILAPEPIDTTVRVHKTEPETLEELLDRHYEATGGFDRQRNLNSFYMSGTLEIEGTRYPVTVVKKAPNLSRTSIQFPNGDYILGFDGKTVWSQQLSANKDMIIKKVTGHEADVYVLDARINSRLFEYGDGTFDMELLDKKEDVGTHACFVVRVTRTDGGEHLHYIDARNYMERKVSQRRNDIVEEAVYLRHKDFGGITVPSEIDIYRNGKISSRITVDSIQFDGGIVSSIFRMPEPTREN